MNQIATKTQSAAIVPASFVQGRRMLADGCWRDERNALLAADGTRYFLEWTPILARDISRSKGLKLCEACELDGGGWTAPEAHEAFGAFVNHAFEAPATHPELREETPPYGWMITKTVDPSSPSGFAFYVHFSDGNVNYDLQNGSGFVRAVRRVPASQ